MVTSSVGKKLATVALLWPLLVLVAAGSLYLQTNHRSVDTNIAEPPPARTTIPESQPPAVISPSPVATAVAPSAVARAKQLLTTISITGRKFVAGYERALFGAGWKDPDRNGCDARNDILRRDLSDVVFRRGTNNCVVIRGVLADPYTGKTINFVKGNVTSMAVQIDHIVPVGWSWQHGAANWSAAKREKFYNDPLNLLAVDGPANESKSDSGPADWLPPHSASDCAYVVRFVAVVGRYSMTIDARDRSSIRRVLNGCTW
jgi:hypothetical protein